MTTRTTVRPVEADDHDQWRALYHGYAAFYGVDQADEMAERVWSWINDPGHEVEALVAVGADGRLVGLAHHRPFARPLSASVGGFLDDLFVDPASRGTGAADLLLDELRAVAAARGWTVVRWITDADNHRARGMYERVATRTTWVTYDLAPHESGAGSGSEPDGADGGSAGRILEEGYALAPEIVHNGLDHEI